MFRHITAKTDVELSIVCTYENSKMNTHMEATFSSEESQNVTRDSQKMLNLLACGLSTVLTGYICEL